jgi:hypothetical protein
MAEVGARAVPVPRTSPLRQTCKATKMKLVTTSSSADEVQLEYLVATVQGQLRSGLAGPFVKVEGCCD